MSDVSLRGPILVPVDFSGDSKAALLWALSLAKAIGVAVEVLHVVHDPAEQPGYYLEALADRQIDLEEQLPRLERAASALLNNQLENLRGDHSELMDGVSISKKLVVGLPEQQILAVAENVSAGMIVMGSRGRTGMKRLMMGSKAERVVRLARCPVVVIKSPEPSD